jgi:ABC-type multidrug transport system ATPase subunit
VKYAAAIAHAPSVLLLDEPSANLDQEGRAFVAELIESQRRRGLVVLATNDEADLASADLRLHLGE